MVDLTLFIGATVGVFALIGIIVIVFLLVKGKKPKNKVKKEVEAVKKEVGRMEEKKEVKKEEKVVTKKSGKVVTKVEEPLFSIDKKVVPNIPEYKDLTKVDIKYDLVPPYAYAQIKWDEESTELIYKVIEPKLSDKEKKTLNILEEGIKELINLSFISVKDSNTILVYLEKNIKVLLTELSIKLTTESYLKIMYYIYRDFVGLNQLEPLMNDYYIEDVECNGLNSAVYVVHRKFSNLKTNLVYKDMHALGAFVEKLAQKCGKYVSYADPLLDGSLPDGSRVNATYTTDISSKGPTYTIRKFTKEPWSPIQLMQKGTVSAEMLAYLWMLIEYEHSLMVVGGTGSGKTSLLNVIAFFIPPQSRVVTIEDTRELSLEHENWLPSVSRGGVGLTNMAGQKYGEVSLFDLLKESFRQRPDYVIVGEVRGKEAYVLMQGIASGHPGMGTMHADSVSTMIRRLVTPPINLSGSLINSLSAVCVMAQTKVKGKTVRRLTNIDEIVDIKETLGGEELNVVFNWNAAQDVFGFNPNSHVFKEISVHFGIAMPVLMNEFHLRLKLIMELYKRKIYLFQEVQKIIHEYYKSPKTVLKRFGLA